ncbi:hypothetical protein D3C87_1176820 [compost metagenome]
MVSGIDYKVLYETGQLQLYLLKHEMELVRNEVKILEKMLEIRSRQSLEKDIRIKALEKQIEI